MVAVGAERVLVRRASVAVGLCALGAVAGALVLLAVFASAALPWFVAAVLVAAVAGVITLGIHAGGHGWFVPLPVLVLAGIWAVTASTGHWASALAWVLAALAMSAAVAAAILVLPALAYRRAAPHGLAAASLVGATGTALSLLDPRGIARVNNETWSVESMSGPLPAGTPVHVVKVEGLRLLVWSEAGTVPGPDALSPGHQEARQEEAHQGTEGP